MFEGTTEPDSLNPKEASSFDIDRSVKFFVASNNHSQGHPLGLQSYIFEFAHRQMPMQKISDELRSQLYDKAFNIITKLLKSFDASEYKGKHVEATGHKNVSGEFISENMKITLDDMQRIFNEDYNGRKDLGKKAKISDKELIHRIAKLMVSRDHHYLIKKGGRAERKPQTGAAHEAITHWNDPYFSYVVEYGFRGKTTEDPIIDLLYAEVRKHYLEVLEINTTSSDFPTQNLQEILTVYNQTHPDNPFIIEAK